MALTPSAHTITLLVMKPGSGTKEPALYFPSLEDTNKFDFAHARFSATYDHTDSSFHLLFVDNTTYYP